MGAYWPSIPDKIRSFVMKQPLFFVATAPKDGHINLSPKGMQTFRCFDEKTVGYLDLTGSGNETAAHITDNGRVTFMFCAFEGAPRTIRLYGEGRLVRPKDTDWASLAGQFPALEGTRQIIMASIHRVSTSCGFSIPIMEYKTERTALIEWTRKHSADELDAYRHEKNTLSIDGLPTGLFDEGA